MIHVKNYFIHSPGGENESSNKLTEIENDKSNKTEENPSDKKEEHKPLVKKIKEALQEWSNDDQRDLEFDDTRV